MSIGERIARFSISSALGLIIFALLLVITWKVLFASGRMIVGDVGLPGFVRQTKNFFAGSKASGSVGVEPKSPEPSTVASRSVIFVECWNRDESRHVGGWVLVNEVETPDQYFIFVRADSSFALQAKLGVTYILRPMEGVNPRTRDKGTAAGDEQKLLFSGPLADGHPPLVRLVRNIGG